MRYILLLLAFQPLYALADADTPPLMHRIDAGLFNVNGWTVAESTNGDFSVQMPGPFSDFSMTGGPTAIADHMEGIGGKAPNGIVFTAMKLLYDTKGTASAEFEKFKNGEGLPSPVVKPTTTAGGLPALDISYADENMATNQRIILAGEDLFTLTIEWPAGRGALAVAMYQPFVESFRVLPKTAPKAENPTIWQHDQLNLAFMRTLTKDACMKKTIATLSHWGCASQQCRVNVGEPQPIASPRLRGTRRSSAQTIRAGISTNPAARMALMRIAARSWGWSRKESAPRRSRANSVAR